MFDKAYFIVIFIWNIFLILFIMSITHIITPEELKELEILLKSPNTVWQFQNKIKLRIVKTLTQISDDEFNIWTKSFVVTVIDWVVWLQDKVTGRFRSVDELDINVVWEEILDFVWEKLVRVEINDEETFFAIDSDTFILPLNF